MNTQERLPSDAIIVDRIEIPKRVTVTSVILDIIERFYTQEFTYRHVYGCLLADPRVNKRGQLDETARSIIHKLYKTGKIKRVKAGGRGGPLSVYRNLTEHERQECA